MGLETSDLTPANWTIRSEKFPVEFIGQPGGYGGEAIAVQRAAAHPITSLARSDVDDLLPGRRASVLSASRVRRLSLFPWHRRLGSHVPYKSLVELRAIYMPDAARSVSGHPPS